MKKKKLYLVQAVVDENAPFYTFMVDGKDKRDARKKAEIVIENDYGWAGYIFLHQLKGLEDVKKWLYIDFEKVYPSS